MKQFIEASETNQSVNLNQKALKLKQITQIVSSVVSLMTKDSVLLTAKFAIIVAIKIILRQNVNLNQSLTQRGKLNPFVNVANVVTGRSTVLNTVKKNRVSQIQTQME